MLSSWLYRARACPWNTQKVGQTWATAGKRYLQIATSPHSCTYPPPSTYTLQASLLAAAEAEPDDALVQLFGDDILRETLGCPKVLGVVD
jgi:hypothetical protein